MCDIGSGEAPKVFIETTVKARKEHVCCECGATITVGERYENVRGLWDNWQTFKTCLFCSEVRQQATSEMLYYDEGFPFEQLWECVDFDYAVGLITEEIVTT